MSRSLVTLCLALVSMGTASAAITVGVVEVDTSGAASYTDLAVNVAAWASAGYRVYDLQVTVTGNDSWTTASCDITLVGGTFWDHPNGNEQQPQTSMFSFFGLLRFDSFFCSSEEWPNPDLNPAANATTFAPGSPSGITSTHRFAEWYNDPLAPTAYDGTYTIARFAVLPTSPNGYMYGGGDVYLASTGGVPHPYTIWPEPNSLALLTLGALTLARRR